MTIAVNDAGDVLTLDNGAWKPAIRAMNDKTGETLVLDAGAWKPLPKAAPALEPGTETGPAVEAPKQSAFTRYNEPGTETGPDAETPDPNSSMSKIVGAATQAWQDTPPLLTPKGQEMVDQTGPIGRQIINPALKIAGAVPAVAHAGMAALSQSLMQVFGEKGGRDALALLSSLPMVHPEMQAAVSRGLPTDPLPAEPPRPQFVSERMMPPDDVGLTPLHRIQQLIAHDDMENGIPAPDRGAANQSLIATQNAVMGASDLDGAIEAAGRAAGVGREPVLTGEILPPGMREAGGPITTSKAAKQVASAYYARAEQVGGNLTPEFTNRFLDEAEALTPQTRAGKLVSGEGPTTSLIDRIQDLRDNPLSLREAQEIDEGLGNLIDGEYGVKGLSKEGHNLSQLQTTFRNMIEDAGPGEIEGGTEGFDALVSARKAWAQAMKMDDLERIQARAELQEVPSTGIRTGLRTLLSNKSRIRGYSPEEIAALRQAADRGVLGTALHVFGSRLIPTGLAVHGGATFNPASLAAAGVGYGVSTLARNASTALQGRRLGNAMSVLGDSVPPLPQ